ncbi:winged helix-turn-helix transcriptional regulator [Megasphaera stantonii]|jgi:DNA-binding HxlR family transcriptional regulator|uniref:Transcriptional regulator n=1 Tax=Megasphaera stantonii TaxID=2144175 RepID=A0A346AWM8_9FIRM|nr:helix-turn-helix domain-containing protein [Megasphaera stantonii]AXL20271.1 transcriptional regulator [Megasphaera stantonii]
MKKMYNIGVEATMDVIGGKWKPIILCNLRHGTLRTSELQKKIPNISQKMLIQQLRELERDKIICRKVYQEVPPRVEYSLSTYGITLSDVLDLLCNWGEAHVHKLIAEGHEVSLSCSGQH